VSRTPQEDLDLNPPSPIYLPWVFGLKMTAVICRGRRDVEGSNTLKKSRF
jgi:hypothetical protein